jgi:hypothetical protein
VVTAKAGDTVDSIGKRYGVSGAVMERINRRSRSDALKDGDTVVVYVNPNASPSTTPSTSTSMSVCPLPDPAPLGALPTPPRADLLPPTRL